MKEPKLMSSFRYALRGIAFAFHHERNFRIQLLCAILVFCSFFFFPLRKLEMLLLLLLIGFILVLELLNTAFEKFLDIVKPRLSLQVEIVKDILAGMVLVTACIAFIIAVFIYTPYIVVFFRLT